MNINRNIKKLTFYCVFIVFFSSWYGTSYCYAISKGLSYKGTNNGRPNVLLIMTDQQTYSALGAAGNEEVKTPNLDRLAASGAFFTNCIVPTPYCSPSRASIMTGLNTNKHGVWNNVDENHMPSLDDQKFPVTEEILFKNDTADREERCWKSWNKETCNAAYLAAFICHTSSGGRCRYKIYPEAIGS